jgi:hypothetical protein
MEFEAELSAENFCIVTTLPSWRTGKLDRVKNRSHPAMERVKESFS